MRYAKIMQTSKNLQWHNLWWFREFFAFDRMWDSWQRTFFFTFFYFLLSSFIHRYRMRKVHSCSTFEIQTFHSLYFFFLLIWIDIFFILKWTFNFSFFFFAYNTFVFQMWNKFYFFRSKDIRKNTHKIIDLIRKVIKWNRIV
jgi:hypothetical protein